MAFARDEDSRLASSCDTCCQGYCIPGSGGRVFPSGREDPPRRAGAPACTAPSRNCTACCTGIQCAQASGAIPAQAHLGEDAGGRHRPEVRPDARGPEAALTLSACELPEDGWGWLTIQRGRGRGHRRRVGRALGGSPTPDLPSLGRRSGRGPDRADGRPPEEVIIGGTWGTHGARNTASGGVGWHPVSSAGTTAVRVIAGDRPISPGNEKRPQ
jgi:hypothetical protein